MGTITAQMVLATYEHEVAERGEWGAYRRTGQRYQRSDEWARKKCKQARELNDRGIQVPPYEPPPGGYVPPKMPTIAKESQPIPQVSPTADNDITSSLSLDGPGWQAAELPTPTCQPRQYQGPAPVLASRKTVEYRRGIVRYLWDEWGGFPFGVIVVIILIAVQYLL